MFVSKKFRICHLYAQIFSNTSQPSENFPVLNYLLTCGITGHPSRLSLLQRSYEGHRAFMVAIPYGIQLLEREPRNAADRHHSNRHRIVSGCLTSNRKRRCSLIPDVTWTRIAFFTAVDPRSHAQNSVVGVNNAGSKVVGSLRITVSCR